MGVLISDQRNQVQRLRLIIDLLGFRGLFLILDLILDLFTSGGSSGVVARICSS